MFQYNKDFAAEKTALSPQVRRAYKSLVWNWLKHEV